MPHSQERERESEREFNEAAHSRLLLMTHWKRPEGRKPLC